MPQEEQNKCYSTYEQYLEQLMIETEKFLADKTLTKFPKELELLLQLKN